MAIFYLATRRTSALRELYQTATHAGIYTAIICAEGMDSHHFCICETLVILNRLT